MGSPLNRWSLWVKERAGEQECATMTRNDWKKHARFLVSMFDGVLTQLFGWLSSVLHIVCIFFMSVARDSPAMGPVYIRD